MGDGPPAELRPRGAETLRFRTIHGYRRAYRLAGRGPALLLLHGIGDCSESWMPVIEDLARDHTVIAPDLLGHGQSDKPRADYSVAAFANGMRDLLEVLGIDRVTLVGHSLGGGIAAQFAYQYPERCERLVLVATGGVARELTPALRLAAAPLSELLLLPLRYVPPGAAARAVVTAMRLLGKDLDRDGDDVCRIVGRLSDDGSRRAFVRTLRSVVDWRGQVVTLRDRCYLSEAMPTLVVWGGRDGVIPVDHAALLEAAMPHCRLELFPEAGHSPHRSEPARFVAVLRDFLASTQPAVHDPGRLRALLRRGPAAATADDATVVAAFRAGAQALSRTNGQRPARRIAAARAEAAAGPSPAAGAEAAGVPEAAGGLGGA